MATITRTIPDALIPRIFAAFNAKYRGRDVTSTNTQIVNGAVDAFIKAVVAEYEAAQASAAAAAQANSDIAIS